MSSRIPNVHADRVLILAPTGNDAGNAVLVLEKSGLVGEICRDLLDLCEKAHTGGAGALLIAEEGLTFVGMSTFAKFIADQPPWSDIPVLLITRSIPISGLQGTVLFEELGNVTLLDRPFRAVTLVSSVQAALRARRRQYQMRDILQEQQMILASIQDAFFTLDFAWRYTYVNDQAAKLVQSSREMMLGRNCWELFPQAASEFLGALQHTMEQRVPSSIEHYYEPRGLWFESRAYPSTSGIAVFTTDITQRKQAEKLLRESHVSLEARVEERTVELMETIAELEAFSYSVSHDLRSPLRAMQGYSNILLEDYSNVLDVDGVNYVRRILNSSLRLDRLVQDILTYSRVSREKLHLTGVDLEKLIPDVIQNYPALQPAHADIQIQVPLLRVMGHEASLIQCISNLLGNAVKFVHKGTRPAVQVWTELRGAKVRLNIRDNGIGIAPEYQERIFKIFEKVNANASYEGTGIGLAIVRKAVERMGGEVGLDSMPGHGSTFWIELHGVA